MKIYCVEDDNGIRDMMVYSLNSMGFEAKGFPEAGEFFNMLKKEKPDLIVLDIMLPDKDGVEILKQIRLDNSLQAIPVIMATAKGSELDKVMALDQGADDYLVKPFGMLELASRIKAVLRRSNKTKDSQLSLGNITIDKNKHRAYVSQRPLEMTLKEYELLCLFLSNQDRVFTREQLLAMIWGVDYLGETRTVDVHISSLRNKLKNSDCRIKTVRGVGYAIELEN